jgi:2-polyprenyl-3-methyl-5-hydroxy-6-metoxy-1,4-benzoquinol methylase
MRPSVCKSRAAAALSPEESILSIGVMASALRGRGELVMSVTLTARQERERRYYDQYVKQIPPRPVMPVVAGGERRPWNAYWYVLQLVAEQFRSPTQRLLDFGCGPGAYAVQFARIGYEVHGFDISEGNIEFAQALAAAEDVGGRIRFSVDHAEALSYPSAYFDVVVGIDVLHHVEIGPAIAECLRVLKPGGVAIFKEPVTAPWLDRLRNSRLGLALRPKSVSFECHITADERKLTADDLRLIHEVCDCQERRFRLLTRMECFVGKMFYNKAGASRLEMFDAWLLRYVPWLRSFTGTVVVTCRHPR